MQKFKYLDIIVTKDNKIKEEIKEIIENGNKWFWSLRKTFRNRDIPLNLKIRAYETDILYGP